MLVGRAFHSRALESHTLSFGFNGNPDGRRRDSADATAPELCSGEPTLALPSGLANSYA